MNETKKTTSIKFKSMLSKIGSFFGKVKNSIAQNLKGLKTLVPMQLKNKLNMSFLQNKKQFIAKTVFFILGFLASTAIAFALFTFIVMFNIVDLSLIIPVRFMIPLFIVLFVISLISTTLGLTKSLYFDNDNKILLTLPVKPNAVFLSKLIVYFILTIKNNFSLFLPIFWGFALVNGLGIGFYFYTLFTVLILSLLIVALAAVLSIPAMYITNFLKKLPIVQAILFLGVFGAISYVIVRLINLIPANVNINRDLKTIREVSKQFFRDFQAAVTPFDAVVKFFTGNFDVRFNHAIWTSEGGYALLAMIGVIIVCALFAWFIQKALFFKMASSSFENKASLNKKEHKNYKLPKFVSNLKHQMTLTYKNPEAFFGSISYLIVLPFLIFLLNKIFWAINVNSIGITMIIASNVFIISLLVMVNNTSAASVFSGDGQAGVLSKINPIKDKADLMFKLSINTILTIVSVGITMIIIKNLTSLTSLEMWVVFISIMTLYVIHTAFSVDLDLNNPQYEYYISYKKHRSTNPNEVKSSILAFILGFAIFGITLFVLIKDINDYNVKRLVPEGMSLVTYDLLKVGIVLIVLAAIKVFLTLKRLKALYRDI